mgnify:CR=1 FL=1
MTGWLIAYLVSAGLALGSSVYNIEHGCREHYGAARIYGTRPHPLVIGTVYGARTASIGLIGHWVWGQSPTSGKFLFGGMTALQTWDAVHNIRADCRQ